VGHILSGSFGASYTIPNTSPSHSHLTHPNLYLLLYQACVKTFHWCLSLLYTNAMLQVLINMFLSQQKLGCMNYVVG
jgi:hypothetical protein